MNHLKAIVEHIAFIANPVEQFSFNIGNSKVQLYSRHENLHLEIVGRKTIQKLQDLFFDINSLLFVYLGSSPKLSELIENGLSVDISQFSGKYIPSKLFYKKEAVICPINNKTLNAGILKRYICSNVMPIHSLQFLLSKAYDKIAVDHRITLLLHVVDGLVADNNVKATKNHLCSKYPQRYNQKSIGNYFCSVYYLCQNYFFNYHRKFACNILSLLKTTKLQFVQISADTRNWYSHFLGEKTKPNRLKTGEEMLIWFDILHYAIRLMVVSQLDLSIDQNIIKEYYYILHDWILTIKHDNDNDLKSNVYKNK